ncbi:MAG: voltage-gated potassium channel [Saprospiraceae bacterium]|jgi:voltage-gated potassium channel
MKLKKRVHKFITSNPEFLKFIYGLIILNVVAIILESYKEIRIQYGDILNIFELISVIVFTLEYILRFWTAEYEKYKKPLLGSEKLQFVISKYGIIDLVAILPFYLPLLFALDLRVLRILRLFRLLRIFKLGRLSKSLKTINSVLKETRGDLAISVFVAFVLLILSSTLMYYFESDVQPDKFKNIGQSLWWAVATLTTVGYGDVYPVTGIGKLLSGVVALIGIGFVALPTSILSSAFVERVQKNRNKKNIDYCECPHCGEEFEIEV